MNDRAIGTRARNGLETHIDGGGLVAAEGFELLDDIDLGEVATRRLAVEPGQKPRHRDAIELMGLAHAGKLDLVLFRLGQQDGVALFDEFRAAIGKDHAHARGGGGRIEPDRFSSGGKLFERGGEFALFAQGGDICQRLAVFIGELVFGHEYRGFALCRDDGEAEDERVVRHVAPADVEQPAQRFRQGEDRGLGTFIPHGLAKISQLVVRRLARAVVAKGLNGALRRGGTVLPERVYGVFDRFERDAGFIERGLEAIKHAGRQQPGVKTQPRAFGKILRDPCAGACERRVDDGEDRRVGLGGGLQRIAAVDEQPGGFRADDGEPRRTGEAGDIGKARIAFGDVFALMHIGAGHDEAIEVLAVEVSAQRGDARGHLGRIGLFLETLEDGVGDQRA